MAASDPGPAAWRPVAWSLVGHGLLVALLVVNLPFWSKTANQPVRLAIEAAIVADVNVVQEREQAADQRRREEAERRRAEEARRVQAQREAELVRQRKVEEQRKAEDAQRREAERIAVEKRRAEEQRQREADERRKAEAARRAEEQRQAERAREREAQVRREAEARRQQERETQLAAALAAEQERENAVSGGQLDQWIEVIRQQVQRNWIRPASARAGLECEVRVMQIPGGEVVDVRVGQCNGDTAVVRSIENAVYKASPLPSPPNPSLFERNITLIFKPTD